MLNAEAGRLGGIEAVTFDAGGTLFEPWPSVGHVYAETAAAYGAPGLSPERLNARFALVWQERRDFKYTRADWSALVDATFEGMTPEPPSRSFFPELYDRFTTAGAWRLFPDTLPALRQLRLLGMKLGLVSNWDERLRPLLEELGLAKAFDTIVISSEAGCCKPAPEIFESAAKTLGVPLAATLHVGDSRTEDYDGAVRAGARALLIARANAMSEEAGMIRTLSEVATCAGEFPISDFR